MSREVRIHDMPEEKLLDSVIGKALATVLAALVLLVAGQGLVIWKNQDSFQKELTRIGDSLEIVHRLSERLLKLEGNRETAFGRIQQLENTVGGTASERAQRGGSFRRNDATILKEAMTDANTVQDTRLATLENKVANSENRISECRQRSIGFVLKEDFDELEEDVESLKEEHEEAYEELSLRCEKVLRMVGDKDD